ncbi:MAG: hypothetical protein ABI222_14800 [Opitutaceae bacterium]
MILISPQSNTSPNRETPPAIVRKVTREDVLWNRPVFRAPPLIVSLPVVPNLSSELNSVTTNPAHS